jgi:hypothetical protein
MHLMAAGTLDLAGLAGLALAGAATDGGSIHICGICGGICRGICRGICICGVLLLGGGTKQPVQESSALSTGCTTSGHCFLFIE